MEAFLSNPNEVTASAMLGSEGLEELIMNCQNKEQAADVLRLLFLLNRFNIVEAVGVEKLCNLLKVSYLQGLILDNLQGIFLPDGDYSELVNELFRIFVGEDIGCYRLAHLVLVRKFGKIIVSEKYMGVVEKLMQSEDSVAKVRTLELVIELANSIDFDIFDRHGLIDIGISMITCGDILLQIVAIEVIIELGNSESGCKKLINPQVQQILLSAFENQPDPKFRDRLTLMSAKIVHYTGNFTLITENYWKILEKMLQGADVSSIKTALASIGFISSRPLGLSTYLSKPSLISDLKSIQKSANQSSKSYFYHFLSQFLPLLNEEQLTQFMSLTQFIQPMINELLNPFQELHSDILASCIVLVSYQSQGLSLVSHPKFKEYLFKRPPHQVHQVSCLKFEIVEKLNKLELPQALKLNCEKYLNAGVFAGPGDEDVELDSLT